MDADYSDYLNAEQLLRRADGMAVATLMASMAILAAVLAAALLMP